jgi:hypothetical protein
MRMVEEHSEKERLPVASPLKVVDYRTINKAFGWWQAVVLIESWGKNSINFYLWQKKDKGWRRKQKFTVRNQEDWELIANSVEKFLPKL